MTLKRCLYGNSVDGKTKPGNMKLEEFLRKWGKKYDLRVNSDEGMLHITIQSLTIDGDDTSKEFMVKDNLVFPIG